MRVGNTTGGARHIIWEQGTLFESRSHSMGARHITQEQGTLVGTQQDTLHGQHSKAHYMEARPIT